MMEAGQRPAMDAAWQRQNEAAEGTADHGPGPPSHTSRSHVSSMIWTGEEDDVEMESS